MEEIFPAYTPVEHKKEGYKGWISTDEPTEKDGKLQYRVMIKGGDVIKNAPHEDLERILTGAEFPPISIHKNDGIPGYSRSKESLLHILGYNVDKEGKNSSGRWEILEYVAIPILGIKEVIGMILWLIDKSKNDRAIKEWLKDLEAISNRFSDNPEIKALNLPEKINTINKALASKGFPKISTRTNTPFEL